MECPICGEPDLFPNETLFEDEEATCQRCGLMCRIAIDGDCECGSESCAEEHSGAAWVNHDDQHEDKGQPRCDASCLNGLRVTDDWRNTFLGKPCSWICPRALEGGES